MNNMERNINTDLKNINTTKVTAIENGGQILYEKISTLIEKSRREIYSHAARITTFLFWEIGKHINNDILENERADYGVNGELPIFVIEQSRSAAGCMIKFSSTNIIYKYSVRLY